MKETTANINFALRTVQEKLLIEGTVEGKIPFLNPELKKHAMRLFNKLDTDKNKSLGADDFRHEDAATNDILEKAWNGIRDFFDIDGNDTVDFDEFLKYFVMMASHGEITIQNDLLIKKLKSLRDAFSSRLAQELSRVEVELSPSLNIILTMKSKAIPIENLSDKKKRKVDTHQETVASKNYNARTPREIELISLIVNEEFSKEGEPSSLLGLLTLRDKNLVEGLFKKIDVTKDGKLGPDDFFHADAERNRSFQRVWSSIRDSFDVDGDGTVDFDEFLTYFVMMAIHGQVTEEYEAFSTTLNNLQKVFAERFLAELNRVAMELLPFQNLAPYVDKDASVSTNSIFEIIIGRPIVSKTPKSMLGNMNAKTTLICLMTLLVLILLVWGLFMTDTPSEL